MLSTSLALNTLTTEKYLGKFNKLRVLLPAPNLIHLTPADLIPAIKTWLGPDQVELSITINNVHIDTETNIYQHYNQLVILDNTEGQPQLDILTQLRGKMDIFNLTKEDRLINYTTRKLVKYENNIAGIIVDNQNNIFLPINFKQLVHVHMPEKDHTLCEKYLEYRFNLLEFGREPASIFIKQMQFPGHSGGSTNLIIGIDFSVNEKENISDERLKLIIKYISGLEIILKATY